MLVDLSQNEYEEAKLLAGSSENIPHFLKKIFKEYVEKWKIKNSSR